MVSVRPARSSVSIVTLICGLLLTTPLGIIATGADASDEILYLGQPGQDIVYSTSQAIRWEGDIVVLGTIMTASGVGPGDHGVSLSLISSGTIAIRGGIVTGSGAPGSSAVDGGNGGDLTLEAAALDLARGAVVGTGSGGSVVERVVENLPTHVDALFAGRAGGRGGDIVAKVGVARSSGLVSLGSGGDGESINITFAPTMAGRTVTAIGGDGGRSGIIRGAAESVERLIFDSIIASPQGGDGGDASAAAVCSLDGPDQDLYDNPAPGQDTSATAQSGGDGCDGLSAGGDGTDGGNGGMARARGGDGASGGALLGAGGRGGHGHAVSGAGGHGGDGVQGSDGPDGSGGGANCVGGSDGFDGMAGGDGGNAGSGGYARALGGNGGGGTQSSGPGGAAHASALGGGEGGNGKRGGNGGDGREAGDGGRGGHAGVGGNGGNAWARGGDSGDTYQGGTIGSPGAPAGGAGGGGGPGSPGAGGAGGDDPSPGYCIQQFGDPGSTGSNADRGTDGDFDSAHGSRGDYSYDPFQDILPIPISGFAPPTVAQPEQQVFATHYMATACAPYEKNITSAQWTFATGDEPFQNWTGSNCVEVDPVSTTYSLPGNYDGLLTVTDEVNNKGRFHFTTKVEPMSDVLAAPCSGTCAANVSTDDEGSVLLSQTVDGFESAVRFDLQSSVQNGQATSAEFVVGPTPGPIRAASFFQAEADDAPDGNMTVLAVGHDGKLNEVIWQPDGRLSYRTQSGSIDLGAAQPGTGWHRVEMLMSPDGVVINVDGDVEGPFDSDAPDLIDSLVFGGAPDTNGTFTIARPMLTTGGMQPGLQVYESFPSATLGAAWESTGSPQLVAAGTSALASKESYTIVLNGETVPVQISRGLLSAAPELSVELDVHVPSGAQFEDFDLIHLASNNTTVARAFLGDDNYAIDFANGASVERNHTVIDSDVYHTLRVDVIGSRYAVVLDDLKLGVFESGAVGAIDEIRLGGVGIAAIDDIRVGNIEYEAIERFGSPAWREPGEWNETNTFEGSLHSNALEFALGGVHIESPYATAGESGTVYVGREFDQNLRHAEFDFWYLRPAAEPTTPQFNMFEVLSIKTDNGATAGFGYATNSDDLHMMTNDAWDGASTGRDGLAGTWYHYFVDVEPYGTSQLKVQVYQGEGRTHIGTRAISGSTVAAIAFGDRVDDHDVLNNRIGSGEGVWDDIRISRLNTPPVLTLSEPTATSVNLGSNRTISFSGTAQEPDFGDNIKIVEYRIDDGPWNVLPGLTRWSFEWNTTGELDGTYPVEIRAWDGRDHSATAKVYVVIDNRAPTIAISKPPSGANIGSYRTIPITGSAADPDYLDRVTKVEVRIDNGAWALATGTDTWSYIWDASAAPDGSHTIAVRAWDHLLSSTQTRTVTVNNHAPSGSFSLPQDGSSLGGNVTVSGVASDTDYLDSVQEVEYKIDSSPWSSTLGLTNWDFVLDTSAFTDGSHSASVRMKDHSDYGYAVGSLQIDNSASPWIAEGQRRYDDLSSSGDVDYVRFDVPSGTGELRFDLFGPAGQNFDIYVHRGAQPTELVNLGSSTGSGSRETIVMSNPLPGTYYVMVKSTQGSGQYWAVHSLEDGGIF